MSLIPPGFLFRVCYPCIYVSDFPVRKGDDLLALPKECRLPEEVRLVEKPGYAEVRTAWNESGLGFELTVRGKEHSIRGEAGKYQNSDGISLWIDTRSTRESHRATRFCHHFFFLAGNEGDNDVAPSAGQAKIHRALADAPLCRPELLQVRKHRVKGGYRLECFLPVEVLHGFDVELNRQLGFYYLVRDRELGEQTLSVDSVFPYAEDPSLWQLLELQEAGKTTH